MKFIYNACLQLQLFNFYEGAKALKEYRKIYRLTKCVLAKGGCSEDKRYLTTFSNLLNRMTGFFRIDFFNETKHLNRIIIL